MTFDLDDANLDRLLADAAPPTPEFAPPRSVREAIVTSNVTRTRRRLRARWVLAPSAAAVALSALLLAAGPQRDGSIQTANAAATVLDRAADMTERAPRYPAGQLRYVREFENLGDGPFVIETWRRADGSIARRVITHGGSTREAPISAQDAAALPWTGLNEQQILALPSHPERLLAAIRAAMARPQPVESIGPDGQWTRHTTKVPFTDRQVFTAIMALHDVELPLSNQQRAGLLRAGARIPGVVSLGRIRDPLGRTGDAISVRGDDDAGTTVRVYVLSPTSGHTIATLEVRQGVVTGWSARQEAGATDTHQRPLPAASASLPRRYRFDAAKLSPGPARPARRRLTTADLAARAAGLD